MLLVERIGWIRLIVGSYLCGSISVFLLCIFVNQAWRPGLISLSFFSRIFEMSGSCSLLIFTSEVLSTEIRSTGHSAVNALGKIGGFVSPYLVSGKLSFPHLGVCMVIIHITLALCASRLPGTKGVEFGQAWIANEETQLIPASHSDHSAETEII